MIKRWRNPGFSQSVKIFESVSVVLQKIKGILNTIKRYSGRVFMKFERVEGSFENFIWCTFY